MIYKFLRIYDISTRMDYDEIEVLDAKYEIIKVYKGRVNPNDVRKTYIFNGFSKIHDMYLIAKFDDNDQYVDCTVSVVDDINKIEIINCGTFETRCCNKAFEKES